MRLIGLLVATTAAACGAPPISAPTAPGPTPPTPPRGHARAELDDAVDPLVELARPEPPLGWVQPRQLRADTRAEALDAPPGTPPQQAQILERHGGDLRIGVRLPTARVAVWTEASALFGTMVRDAHVGQRAGGEGHLDSEGEAILRAGARVTILGHEPAWTHVRYEGELAVEGWVPHDAVGVRAEATDRHGRAFGAHVITALPGTAIRVAAQWSARLLAVTWRGYFLVDERDLGDGKHVVAFQDDDVEVHGFVSLHDPPEPTRGAHPPEAPAPPAPTPTTATAPSGACVYGRVDGEPIGFLVGDSAVALEPLQGSWLRLTLDTVWGPLALVVRGAAPSELVTCAPAGSVPPSALTPTAP